MARDTIHLSSIPSQAEAELELVEIVLNQCETPYPWNPATPEVWSYLEALEQEVAENWSEEEFTPYVQTLSNHFEQAWNLFPTPSPAQELFQRFSAQMPTALLDTIVQRAKNVAMQPITLADQLVLCVQDLLPAWSVDDLQVLARPLAYAMRSETQDIEGVLQSVRCASWESLSEVEQARISLAIARYVLSQPTPQADA